MDYHDEKLVALKLKKHALKHTDIKKDGIYVNDEFIKFQLIKVIEDIALYHPSKRDDQKVNPAFSVYGRTGRNDTTRADSGDV